MVAAVLTRAEEVVRKVPTRTLDAIHIASALFFRDTGGVHVTFLTADRNQRQSAEAVGLTVRSLVR